MENQEPAWNGSDNPVGSTGYPKSVLKQRLGKIRHTLGNAYMDRDWKDWDWLQKWVDE